MRKFTCLVAVGILVCLVFLPMVSASVSLVASSTDSYSFSDVFLNALHPTAVAGRYSGAVSRVIPSTEYFPVAYQVNMTKTGVPNAALRGVLLDSSFAELGVSNMTIDSTTLTGTSTAFNFTFTGDVQFNTGTTYYVGVIVESAVLIDESNRVNIHSGFVYNANTKSYLGTSGGAWINDYVIYMSLFGETTGVGATPTPAPTSSDSGDATLAYWANIIMPWLVPMLLVLVPAFLGLKFLGQLGFYVGLNIGVVITYFMLPTYNLLWAVLLMGVMDLVIVFYKR